MNLLLFLLRSSWILVTLAITAGFISGGCSAGLIALISRAISQGAVAEIPALAIGFGGLALIALVTSILSQVMLIRLSQKAVFELRLQLARQILASDLSRLEGLGNPRLLATLTEDIQSVANAVFMIPFLCIDLAIVVGCLAYITWLSWLVLVLVLVLMGLAVGSCQLLINQGSKRLTLAREVQDDLYGHLRSLTEGIKELKLNYRRRQAFVQEDLEVTAGRFRRHNIEGLTLFSATSSWGKLIFFFAIGFVLFSLPKLLTLPAQTLSGYILTFTYLMLPMDNLINGLPVLSRAGIALAKIESLGLDLAQHAEQESVPPAIHTRWDKLSLNQVSHIYRQDEEEGFTFGPVDLTLYPGELVFIIGGNGSGKSTLSKLLTGLYTPSQGEIWLDGERIDSHNREWYRQHFSAVFSDFYLFERLLGLDNPDLDAKARHYLKKLQLEHKVEIHQGHLSTTALSQGQRKRLTLLVAYLEDRPIYLFDEWAADQDPQFREVFYTEFLAGLRNQGKTVLVISHDDHYFHLADRVIKLNYGQIEYDRYLTAGR